MTYKFNYRTRVPDTEAGRMQEFCEQVKASVRAKVEHPFHIIKNLFGLRKVRYKGLAKNHAQLMTLFGLANLLIAKRSLFELRAKAQAQGG
jgi:transposase, IS5 family